MYAHFHRNPKPPFRITEGILSYNPTKRTAFRGKGTKLQIYIYFAGEEKQGFRYNVSVIEVHI